jgi:hypothetical protein
MRLPRLRAALLGLVAVPALVTSAGPATAAPATEWQDGKSDHDMIYDCWLEKPNTGVSANVGWSADDDEVPEVGEVFYVRAYAGLVGLPCSQSGVQVLPEFLLPTGLQPADDVKPVRWALTKDGQGQVLRTGGLSYFRGLNGGFTIEEEGGGGFNLRQGDVLEIQVPVRATRVLQGPATQRPECQDRIDGDAPCPVDQAGDHLQVAFTVGGHGGDKSYVTPYVGLFAQAGRAPDPDPVVKAASSTSATFTVSRTRAGKAVVAVRSTNRPTGRVVVTDRGRPIGSATLATASAGKVTVRLPRLARGRHVLVVKYAGSATVKPSQSAARTVVVR